MRYFVAKVYDGKATQRVIEQFRPLVIKAAAQYIGAQVNDRLKTALGDDVGQQPEVVTSSAGPSVSAAAPEVIDQKDLADDIVTTDEELEGYNIIRAIAVAEVAPERVVYRDAKTYFAILLDDNNRKPIARLYLNGKSVKYLMTFETGKEGTRRDIDSVVDIYRHAEHIRAVLQQYATPVAAVIDEPPLVSP